MDRSVRSTRRAVVTGVALCSLLSVGACASDDADTASSSLDEMQKITLSLAQFTSEKSQLGVGSTAFAEEVEERSGGKIVIEQYFSGSLVPATESLEAARDGVADIAMVPLAYFPDELPISNWHMGLASALDPAFTLGTLQGVFASNEVFQTFPEIQEEFESNGLKVLATGSSPTFGLVCNGVDGSLGSASGKRVRAAGTAALEAEELGMTPQFMEIPEVYEGLQRGVVDCATALPSAVQEMSWGEVATGYVPTAISRATGSSYVMSLDRWNELPSEAQEIIDEAMQVTNLMTWAREDLEGAKVLATEGVANGLTIHSPDQFNEVLAAYHDEARSELVSTAPDGLGDAGDFVERYDAVLADWRTALLEAGVDEVELDGTPEVVATTLAESPDQDWDAIAELLRSRL